MLNVICNYRLRRCPHICGERSSDWCLPLTKYPPTSVNASTTMEAIVCAVLGFIARVPSSRPKPCATCSNLKALSYCSTGVALQEHIVTHTTSCFLTFGIWSPVIRSAATRQANATTSQSPYSPASSGTDLQRKGSQMQTETDADLTRPSRMTVKKLLKKAAAV